MNSIFAEPYHLQNFSFSFFFSLISFILVKNYQGKSLTIGQWQVLFDGEKLSISEAPHRNVNQLSFLKRVEKKLALKKIGVLWKKSDKHGKDYLTGQLDMGVLGKVQIAVFQTTEKQNEQSPEATIHMFEED